MLGILYLSIKTKERENCTVLDLCISKDREWAAKAPRVVLLNTHCPGKRPCTGWSTRLSILKKALRDATLRLCQRSQLTLPPLNWPTWLTTRSSNDREEVAVDIQTGEQYSSTGSINAQKHLATTVTSRKTLIVFLKMPTLIETDAAIALTCFSNVNLESRMTPKIFNSETISTTEPSINKSGNKGSTVWEREISIPLVLLRFTNMPHLLHQSLITSQIIIQWCCYGWRITRMWYPTKQGRVVSITNQRILKQPWKVSNVQQKQQWTKNTTLWRTRYDINTWTKHTINLNSLSTTGQNNSGKPWTLDNNNIIIVSTGLCVNLIGGNTSMLNCCWRNEVKCDYLFIVQQSPAVVLLEYFVIW